MHYSPNDLVKLDNYKKYADSIIKKSDLMQWKYSSINKLSVEYILYNINLDQINTFPVVYKFTDLSKNISSIYNISYISYDVNKKKFFIDKITPYGSFESKEAEYRGTLLDWNNFLTILDTNKNVKSLYMTIQKHFSKIFNERKLKLTVKVIASVESVIDNQSMKSNILDEIYQLCKPFKIYLYCITWFNCYYEFILGIIPNNLNEDFQHIMFKYKQEDLAFFKRIMKEYNNHDTELLHYICNNNITAHELISNKIDIYESKKLGTRIVLLYEIELQNMFNIQFNIWKDLAITKMVSNLVINKITNGFAILSDWILLNTKDAYIFDNSAQHIKMARSTVAETIANTLIRAQRYTYHEITKNNADKYLNNSSFVFNNAIHDKNAITDTIKSDEFYTLRNNLREDTNYAKTFITSDISINIISEHLGKTFYDTALYKTKNGITLFSNNNYKAFTKYMFELCYNLYILHTKVHCIHGDVHLNNLIFNALFNKKVDIDILEPLILFQLNDDYYVFDNNFIDLTIIDFNQSIINPEYYASFCYQNNSNNVSKDTLLLSQVNNLLDYLYYIKPEYQQHDYIIRNNIKYHFDEYFKILSILDLYAVTDKLLYFTKVSKTIGKVGTNTRSLIHKLNKAASCYLTNSLQSLIETADYNSFTDMEWPMLTIIQDVFMDNKVCNIDKISKNITDIYSYNNKKKSSTSNIDAKALKIIAKNKKIKKYKLKKFINYYF